MDKRLSSFLSTVFSVILGLIAWTLVLMISYKNDEPIDITRGGRYTLAPQSRQAVENLPAPVKVYAFPDAHDKAKAQELLDRYRKVDTKKFAFEVLDPRKNPTTAKRLGIRFTGEGAVELQEGESTRVERLSSIAEQDVTTALLKLQRSKTFKAYFLTGHGEHDPSGTDSRSLSQMKADLVKEGFQIEMLSLTATPKIPADADLIVAAGPVRPLLPGEAKLLSDYLADYGRMMICWEPETPAGWQELIKPYGVEVEDEVALDQASQIIGAEPSFSVGLVYDPSHPITKDYKIQTLFELARPLKIVTPLPAGVTATPLVTTKDNPQTALTLPLKQVLESRGALRLDPNKLKPTTVTLAVAVVKKQPGASTPTPSPTPGAEQPKETKETRLLVTGDADFMENGMMFTINKDLVLNSFSWLAANETQISIRPKDPESTPLTMSGSEQNKLTFLLAILLPGALIGFGAFMVMRRQ